MGLYPLWVPGTQLRVVLKEPTAWQPFPHVQLSHGILPAWLPQGPGGQGREHQAAKPGVLDYSSTAV